MDFGYVWILGLWILGVWILGVWILGVWILGLWIWGVTHPSLLLEINICSFVL
jgi:hypothetical protein